LPEKYAEHGFEAVARLKFDEKYMPEGWDFNEYQKYNNGRPDVVFMRRNPAVTEYKAGDGKYVADYDEASRLAQQPSESFSIRSEDQDARRVAALKDKYGDSVPMVEKLPSQKELDEMKATLPVVETHVKEESGYIDRLEITDPATGKTIGGATLQHQWGKFAEHGVTVEYLYVNAEYRKQGYGQVLYREIAKYAQERGATELKSEFVYPRAMTRRVKLFDTTWKGTEKGVRGLLVHSDVVSRIDPNTSYSIRSQEQIDSVAEAMKQSKMFPEGYLALYERAKVRFASVLESNRDVLLGMEAAGASALKIRNEKLKQALIELDGILKTLPYEVRGRVGGMSVLANIGTGDKALADFFKKRVEMLDKELEKYLSKEYDDATYKFLQTTLPKKREAGEKPKGIGADIQAMFAVVRESMKWNSEEVNRHIAGIDSSLDNDELTPEQEARLVREAALVSAVGDWKNKTSTQKGFALKQLITTWSRGYQQFLTQKLVEKQDRDADRSAAITNTGKDGLLAERQQENLKQNGKLGILKKSYFALTSWDQFVSVIFGEKSETATFLADGERHASNTKEDRTQAKLDEVADLFTRLAGTRLAGEQLRWEMSQKSIAPFQGTPWTGLEFSQLEALSVTVLWMQEDGKRHMEGKLDDAGRPISNWHYTQEFVDMLEKSLSNEAKEVRAFLLDKYAKGYDDINRVYTKLNGVSLPQIANYSPVTVAPINAPKGMSNDPVTGAVVSGMSSSPSALRTRGTSISEPNFRDVLQTYLAHTRQMEHWMSFAPFMHQANGILRNRDVQNAIEAKGGEEARRMLNLHLDIMDKGGVRDAATQLGLNQTFSKIGGRAAQIALVGRVSTILLQSTQLGASLAEMPTGAYILRMSKLLSGNLGWGEALKSPYIQRRLKEMPPIVRQAMEGLQSDRPNVVKHSVEKLGRIISGADALFTAGTYAMVYDYHLKQAKEMGIPSPEEYAHKTAERAVDRLAQPTRMGARSIFENTQTGPFARVGWAFASESRKNLALAAYNTMEKPAGTKARTLFSLLVLNSLAGTLIRNAWKDAKDDDDNELFDEKHWSPKRLALAAMTDPLQGFPIIGDAVKAAAYKVAGEYLPSDNLFSMNNAAGLLSEKHLRNVGELLNGNGDWEMAIKDLDNLVSGMGMWNANIAAASSLTHLASDMFGVGKNATK
jgi:GNAT superfamily N-acetyltransferase